MARTVQQKKKKASGNSKIAAKKLNQAKVLSAGMELMVNKETKKYKKSWYS